jgi:hypothetical protein
MLQTEYLLNHIDALLRLSHETKERAVAAKLRQLADEFRIAVSVTDIADVAATLNHSAAPLARALTGTATVSRLTQGGERERQFA